MNESDAGSQANRDHDAKAPDVGSADLTTLTEAGSDASSIPPVGENRSESGTAEALLWPLAPGRKRVS